MLGRLLLVSLAYGIALGATNGVAQYAVPDEPHTWLTIGDDRAQLAVYPDADCDPECATAKVVCNRLGRIDIGVYNFMRDEVLEWMTATEGPFAGVGAEILFLIYTDGVVTPFIVWNLAMNDFNGTWIAEGIADRRGDAAWLRAFATAEEVVIETPLGPLVLPSRPEDRANRAAFAEACMAM
jgi:hypothetical protein